MIETVVEDLPLQMSEAATPAVHMIVSMPGTVYPGMQHWQRRAARAARIS